MHPQLSQVRNWMETQSRLTRMTPVSTLRAVERIDILTFIEDAVAKLGRSLNTQRSHGLITAKSEGDHFAVLEVYENLVRLHAEVIAAGHSLGTGFALDAGLYQLCGNPLYNGPKQDFKKALMQTFDLPEGHSFD